MPHTQYVSIHLICFVNLLWQICFRGNLIAFGLCLLACLLHINHRKQDSLSPKNYVSILTYNSKYDMREMSKIKIIKYVYVIQYISAKCSSSAYFICFPYNLFLQNSIHWKQGNHDSTMMIKTRKRSWSWLKCLNLVTCGTQVVNPCTLLTLHPPQQPLYHL